MTPTDPWLALDNTIQEQLELRVKLSFEEHHSFLISNGLRECKSVIDFGCGSGTFMNRLAGENPAINFIGVDKREHPLDRAATQGQPNTKWVHADPTTSQLPAEFETADAVLMRYVLLHIPGSIELLKDLQRKVKAGTKFWIIDVDLATFDAKPDSLEFQRLKNIVHEFCEINSVDTMAGQKIGETLQTLGFTTISSKHVPFSSKTILLADSHSS